MARIMLPTGPLMSRELILLTQQIISAQQLAARLKAQIDALTTNGTNTALLESPTGEAQYPTGTGSTIYSGIGQIKTALDGLSALVAVIDQG